MVDVFFYDNLDEQYNHVISCCLKYALIIPLRMALFNLPGQPVVLPEKQRIYHGDLRNRVRPISSKSKNPGADLFRIRRSFQNIIQSERLIQACEFLLHFAVVEKERRKLFTSDKL